MKKFFIMLVGIFAILSLASVLVMFVTQEELMTNFQKVLYPAAGTGAMLVGQTVLRLAKESVYGEWVFKVSVDGQVVRSERQKITPEDGEILIEYSQDWRIVFFGGGSPRYCGNVAAEVLLRNYCFSQGFIIGNIDDVVVDKDERTLTVRLTEEKILRPESLRQLCL